MAVSMDVEDDTEFADSEEEDKDDNCQLKQKQHPAFPTHVQRAKDKNSALDIRISELLARVQAGNQNCFI